MIRRHHGKPIRCTVSDRTPRLDGSVRTSARFWV
jgi:hypothetical protein